jgi:hypothetical protein
VNKPRGKRVKVTDRERQQQQQLQKKNTEIQFKKPDNLRSGWKPIQKAG